MEKKLNKPAEIFASIITAILAITFFGLVVIVCTWLLISMWDWLLG